MGLYSFILKFLVRSCIGVFIICLLVCCTGRNPKASDVYNKGHVYEYAELFEEEWKAPDTATIPKDDQGDLIRYGRELIVNTGSYFGPVGRISRKANGMNCQNCHLLAGTQLYANSFSAVHSIYPKFRSRSGSIEHLERRINDCMERSLNGDALDSMSKEMRAMIAYINWVGKDVKKGIVPEGASIAEVALLDRAADTVRGKIDFEFHCSSCHGKNGAGVLMANGMFEYPPLWGDRSYNTSAGMYRLSRFAGFIKSNMPRLKSSHDKPVLTDEEAWDIAAYVNSKPRPVKYFENDWPDITNKPIDHPFGPFADPFPESQHKYGPFGEIKEFHSKK